MKGSAEDKNLWIIPKRDRLQEVIGWLRPSLNKESVLSLSIWANHLAGLKVIGSITAVLY